jgi:hypothetical protein
MPEETAIEILQAAVQKPNPSDSWDGWVGVTHCNDAEGQYWKTIEALEAHVKACGHCGAEEHVNITEEQKTVVATYYKTHESVLEPPPLKPKAAFLKYWKAYFPVSNAKQAAETAVSDLDHQKNVADYTLLDDTDVHLTPQELVKAVSYANKYVLAKKGQSPNKNKIAIAQAEAWHEVVATISTFGAASAGLEKINAVEQMAANHAAWFPAGPPPVWITWFAKHNVSQATLTSAWLWQGKIAAGETTGKAPKKQVVKKPHTKLKSNKIWKVTAGSISLPGYGVADSGSGEIDTSYAQLPWDLSPGLNIQAQCADFYLLRLADYLEIDTGGKLQERTAFLAHQFRRYTDMAIGGEARHATSQVDLSEAPKPIREALQSGTIPSSRSAAWAAWYHFRQTHGTIAVRWLGELFGLHWKSGGFGGKKWKSIADTLWRYESGMYTDGIFVDTCFGLQHNNGCYFSKAKGPYKWKVPSTLSGLLDAKQSAKPNVEDYAVLAYYASQPIKKLFTEEITPCLQV